MKMPNSGEENSFKGPVHMEASQPAYWAGPVGEIVFILCSYGEIPTPLPRQKFFFIAIINIPVLQVFIPKTKSMIMTTRTRKTKAKQNVS